MVSPISFCFSSPYFKTSFVTSLKLMLLHLLQLLITLFIGLCSSIPIPDSPYGNAFLNVRVVQQHHGGAQTGLGLSVSKQKVS